MRYNPANSRTTSDVCFILRKSDILRTDIHTWESGCIFNSRDLSSRYIQNHIRAALLKLQYFILRLVSHSDMATLISGFDFRRQHTLHIFATYLLRNSRQRTIGSRKSATACQYRESGYWVGALRLVWPLLCRDLGTSSQELIAGGSKGCFVTHWNADGSTTCVGL